MRSEFRKFKLPALPCLVFTSAKYLLLDRLGLRIKPFLPVTIRFVNRIAFLVPSRDYLCIGVSRQYRYGNADTSAVPVTFIRFLQVEYLPMQRHARRAGIAVQ